MINKIKRIAGRVFFNFDGWRTNRKIVVIESDDWGSIRMPSHDVYAKCLKEGYPVDRIAYERYDSLLSQADLDLLFHLLASFEDNQGNHPIITANCVVANPDFKKIKQDNFLRYHYELITNTFKRYPNHSSNFKLWQAGIEKRLFFPQFHAREHLNVSLFMEALQKGDPDVLWGFENEMPGCISKGPVLRGNKFVEATRYFSDEDKKAKQSIYLEGLSLFEKLFGYKSESIIPPNYIWSPDFNKAVFEKGVKFFQGNRKMIEPMPGNKPKYHSYYLGQKNHWGQTYLVRNATFEPSMFKLKIKDPVDRCLSDIAIAFRMNKPAIISCHRINFVGFIDVANRDRSLLLLSSLIKRILQKWPDVEFMQSTQLANIITNSPKKHV